MPRAQTCPTLAGTLSLSTTLTIADPARAGSQVSPVLRDASATSHDYVDPTPMNVSTPSGLGVFFTPLRTSVAQVERIVADLPPGADLVLRCGGLPAVLFGTLVPPAFAGGETLQLGVDDGSVVTTTFQVGDTTLGLITRRINFAHGAPVAYLDAQGRLMLTGARTGGADAAARGWSYGRLVVAGGSALTALGLVAGTVYGAGDDQRLGPGLFVKTFPASALPRLLELSGTASGARFWVAGKAQLGRIHMPLKEVLDRGDTNNIPAAGREARIGSHLWAGGVRLQRETVNVAAAAATPTYAVLQLLFARTISTGAAGIKAAGINGATPGTGAAAPNAGGTSIVFNAETTGTGTVELVYLTTDAVKDADGVVATKLDQASGGLT